MLVMINCDDNDMRMVSGVSSLTNSNLKTLFLWVKCMSLFVFFFFYEKFIFHRHQNFQILSPVGLVTKSQGPWGLLLI